MLGLRPVLKRLASDARFTLLSIGTLATGIGLSVAIFSLVYGVLLAPLPYPDPERLVVVSHDAPGLDLENMDISVPLYLRYRERARGFEELALMRDGRVSLTGLDRSDRVRQGTVSASLFRVAGVQPIRGRAFGEEDERAGAPPVALVSEGFWRGRLGGDPQVLDRSIELDGVSRRILGVLPENFDLPTENIEVWVPIVFDAASQPLGQFSYTAVGRLHEGSSIDAALADLRSVTAAITEEFPGESAAPILARAGFVPVVVPLLERTVGDVRGGLWLLAGAVGFVLLMASVNVANVFLVRAEGRRRELALRAALGASRGRILVDFFTESLLVALAGGALGLAFARVALDALLRFAPEGLPRQAGIALDAPGLAFALAVSIGSAAIVGLLPMLPYARPDVAGMLKEGGRSASASRERLALRRLLVAGQMALGVLLLIGAGLMARSFVELARVTPGFRDAGALTLRLSLPSTPYDAPEKVAAFVERVSGRLAALPGVAAVGAVDYLPLTGSASGSGHAIEEFPLGDDDLPPVFLTHFADPGYLEAMGIPLVEGRWIERVDQEEGRRVSVVSASLARRYWPQGSALGKRLSPGRADDEGWYEIVGVVADVHVEGLQLPVRETVYYPMTAPADGGIDRNVSLVLRAGPGAESLAAPVRETIRELDPNVPITSVLTLEAIVADARAPMAFSMTLLLLAAALAVALGAIGTYGVVSFVVSQRRSEIGVRMALGALRGQIRAMVLKDGVRTVLPGLVVGLLAALAATRFMASLLFEVSAVDPLSFVAAPVALLAVALFSSLFPAERASRVQPVEVLREE